MCAVLSSGVRGPHRSAAAGGRWKQGRQEVRASEAASAAGDAQRPAAGPAEVLLPAGGVVDAAAQAVVSSDASMTAASKQIYHFKRTIIIETETFSKRLIAPATRYRCRRKL